MSATLRHLRGLRIAIVFAAVLGLWLAAPVAGAASAGERGAVLVAPASVDPSVEPVARGMEAWLGTRLDSVGFAAVPRAVLRPHLPEDRSRGLAPERILELAAQLGADWTIFPDLRAMSGQVEVRLRLASVADGRLIAGTRATASLADVGEACENALRSLLAAVGAEVAPVLAPRLDELAASGRSMRLQDRGDLLGAYRQVARRLSPTAVATREDVVRSARDGSTGAPASVRARVLAAAGQGDTAWTLIESDVRRERSQPRPDTGLLLAAAEVELARGNPRGARGYLDALLASGARDADVHRLHARILLEAGDADRARKALGEAYRLDPSNSEIARQLAEVEQGNRRKAELLMTAGRSAAERFDVHRAEKLLERAAKLEPALAGEAWRHRGALQGSLGRPAESLTAYRRAIEVGGDDLDSWRGAADAERVLGQTDAAEQSYAKALTIDPRDADSLHGLGAVHLARNEPAEAVPLLERAVKARPRDLARRRNLAQALRATGDLDAALRVLDIDPGEDPRGAAENLRLVAEIQRARGDDAAALASLERATRLDPYDPDLQEQLALAYEATGDATGAARARELTTRLRGQADAELAGADGGDAPDIRFGPALDGLVASFVGTSQEAAGRRVMQLGIRSPATWRERVFAWLHPRRPDLEGFTNSLDLALARVFDLAEPGDLSNPLLRNSIDRLYDFEDRSSLDATDIATVNQSLGTHAVFVARLIRAPASPESAAVTANCTDPERFEIEVRMLAGQHSHLVEVLQNHRCVPAGFRDYGVWNERAAAAWGAVLLLLLFPVLRGWGKVLVRIELPPKTKGFFAIRISKSAGDLPTDRSRASGDGRLKRSLRSLSRYERHMVGRETIFRWIPARALAYHVTVKGPLMDANGENIIGHFLETQRVRISRRRTAELAFDFNPKECVELLIQRGGRPVPMARTALKGDPASIRYAREGTTVVPVGKGEHRLLVGAEDRVAEYPLLIEDLGRAVRVAVELDDENVLVFRDCPDAVDAYLAGDYQNAADALERAGQDHQAHVVRASFHEAVGSVDAAADEFEAAGYIEEAAKMRAQGADSAGSARLFEQAGDHQRAAEAYAAAGDHAAAARCFEAAYDWDNALDCYREAGDDAKALEILEKTGDYFEAGQLAAQLGDPDRALVNLQQVETRDARYGNACREIAAILEERGDFEIAAEKLREAIECAGNKAPADLHERYGALLARAGQTQLAIGAFKTVQRIDPQRRDLGERIAELERQTQTQAPATTGDGGPEPESRYEILGELGRGAMGVVYKARDKNLGRTVALKRLPANLNDHPTAVALFKREAQAAAALNHRNIVTLFDAGEENGSYFITMELLEGMPLNQILKKRGRLKVSDAARLGVQIAAGLQYAKENCIVHRDIKTGNLFFTRDRTVKIMDFGLAKTIEEVRKSSTMIGGTPYFMAPEQAMGEELDHRADLYAFGVTLYQLVTGTVPFREGDLTYHHRHTPPPDPRTHVPELPAAMAELILHMLAKQSADRPADAAEVGARLQAMLNGGGSA